MKIGLLGYGRMGKMVEDLLKAEGKDEVVLAIHEENAATLTEADLLQPEVVIDFSLPAAANRFIPFFLKNNIPVVSGTTGWGEGELDHIKALSLKNGSAFLHAPNFSIGVNIFFAMNKKLATIMERQSQYDISIDETHHIHKKDAPSGTAIHLADQVIERISRKQEWINKPSDDAKDLVILSHREDEVPGTHIVQYTSNIDNITLTHEAKSREGFARGAIEAAHWISGKKGIFSMEDVLGLKD